VWSWPLLQNVAKVNRSIVLGAFYLGVVLALAAKCSKGQSQLLRM
jgi:hypothetical protein